MALCVVLAGVFLWSVAWGFDGSVAAPSSDPSPSSFVGLVSATPLASATEWETPSLIPSTTPAPTASPTASRTAHATTPPTHAPTASPKPTIPPTPAPPIAHWSPDLVLVKAKDEGRVVVDSSGNAVILDVAPAKPVYPRAAALDTRWSGLIQEPPKTGVDDKGTAYSDANYFRFCGPGTAAVVLYYWPGSHTAVTTKAGYFVEPIQLPAGHYARTYWGSVGPAGYARGMIMYLAEYEMPTPLKGMPWWPTTGMMTWNIAKPDTRIQNMIDTLNWEASGQTRLSYFYVIVRASDLTAAALHDHILSDINMGVPVVVAARISNGTIALPYWNVKAAKTAGNHFVTIVGYDDKAGTYTMVDTCGLMCNTKNRRGGVAIITQSGLYALIQAEVDNDGIMW